MTVQELIERLEKIKDKSVPVVIAEWSIQNPMLAKVDLTTNRLVVHPHRVAILVDEPGQDIGTTTNTAKRKASLIS